MNVYFLTNGVFRTAGTERVILQLASVLKNVIILVPESVECAFLNFDNLNIKSLKIGEFPDSGNIKKIIHRFNYYKKLIDEIDFKQDDIVLSFAFDLNIINILISKKIKYRPIICEHIEYHYHNKFRNLFRKYFYRQAELVCLTEKDKTKFLKDRIRTVVIPNFIVPQSSSYNLNNKNILAIGRLEYQKNFGFLIDSFASSKLYQSGWTLTIVGEGSEYHQLVEKINVLGLVSSIRIHKFTNDISKYYKNAGLFCMTSRFEAFPMVLLESLNFQLPVLVTDFPTGAREILGNDNEQIVEHFEVAEFSESLQKMCLNYNLREKYSNENMQLIKKYYPDAIVESWRKLIFGNIR